MFDNGMDPNDPNSGFHSGGGFGGDPHDIFSMFFNQGGGGFHDDNPFGSSRGGAKTFTFKFG